MELAGGLFLLGLILGSFLHTTAYRMVAEKSLGGRSHCDHCERTIPAWALIPVLGYLIARGRCPFCKMRITPFYPLFELANGLFLAFLGLRLGPGPELIQAILLFEILLLIALCDFWSHEIFLTPLFLAVALQGLWLWYFRPEEILTSFIGLMGGAGLFHWVSTLFGYLRKKEGLGSGDATLLGLLGWIFGYQPLLVIVFLASFLGILGGGLLLWKKKESFGQEIAFGPWLILASLIIWSFPATFRPYFLL